MISLKNEQMTNPRRLLEIEFWGILNFESSLVGLGKYLVEAIGHTDLTRLAEWIVLPENIPDDIVERITEFLKCRVTPNGYSDRYSKYKNIEMTEKQQALHYHVCELLHLKFFGNDSSPERYHYLYTMTPKAFQRISTVFIKQNYVTKEAMFSLYCAYLDRQGRRSENGK